MINRGRVKLLSVFAAVCLALAAAGCAGNAPTAVPTQEAAGSVDEYGDYDEFEVDEPQSAGGEMFFRSVADKGPVTEPTEKKVITSGEMKIETDQFDPAVSGLRQIAQNHGGYLEYAEIYMAAGRDGERRELSAVVKIPADRYETARQRIETLGSVIFYEESVEDATTRYTDMESRLATKRIEEERALALIETAVSGEDTNIQDILALEERLGAIREQIELYETQISSIDALAAFSTLRLTVTEARLKPGVAVDPGLPGRMAGSFAASVQVLINISVAAAVFLAAAVPPLAIIAALAGAGFFITKKVIPKLKARRLR